MNDVEECLMLNKGIKLSVKSLAKRTGLRTKQVRYLCFNSKNIRKIDPMEVGSLKYEINVFTYKFED